MRNYFRFSPVSAPKRRELEGDAFTVERLWAAQEGCETDISHLIDRTYPYHSKRELRWHLAERFDLPVGTLALQKA